MAKETEFDIILWGGSSFVGRLVAEYLYAQYGVNGPLRWAIGGRNEQKLAATRSMLGAGVVHHVSSPELDLDGLRP